MNMTRRRLLDDTFKKSVVGNPAIATDSLARMYPGITMHGWTEQDSTTGAQLFDKNTVDTGKYVSDTDGNIYDGLSDKGTSASDYILVSGLDYICATITSYGQWMAFYDTEKTYVSGKNGYASPIAVPDGAVYARFTIANDCIDSFMVNAGQTLLPYEPYTGNKPSPSPDYPQKIVSAGNYDEGTGKYEYEINVSDAEENPTKSQTVTITSDRPLTKWDKLEKRNGQWGWVYKSGEVIFNGSEGEGWAVYSNELEGTSFFAPLPGSAHGYQISFCNKYKNVIQAWAAGYKNRYCIYSDHINLDTKYFRPPSSSVETVEQWKTWLSENPLTLWNHTATETFVPLTAEEQEQMNALYTFRPTTVLSNDQECEMTLTYKSRKSMEVSE